jgi:hypothetical protein
MLSEWLLFNVKWAFCQPYHDENKLHFNDMMMMLICTRPTRLIGNSATWLKQPSVGRHVAPLGHIILIPSQPVFSLTPCSSVISREATHSNSLYKKKKLICDIIFYLFAHYKMWFGLVWFMVFNVTFNNTSVISWRSVLLVGFDLTT